MCVDAGLEAGLSAAGVQVRGAEQQWQSHGSLVWRCCREVHVFAVTPAEDQELCGDLSTCLKKRVCYEVCMFDTCGMDGRELTPLGNSLETGSEEHDP